MAKNLLIWSAIFLGVLIVVGMFQRPEKTGTVDFSDFLAASENGQIADVTIRGRTISGHYTGDGAAFSTYAADYPDLVKDLRSHNVRINVAPPEDSMNSIFAILLSWFPIFLIVGVWIFFMRQMQGGKGGGGGALGFGRSKAKLLTEKHGVITFNDVSGVEEAKDELEEIVDFLKDPLKFQQLGAKIPKGCLLVGSPGTGKTLLARAVAGEAKVPFFTISGSDFVEMFVGVGASRVRDMFEQAKKNAPCIIFIDEIDAVGRHRGAGLGGGNDEREQTLNQLLVEMDGFEAHAGIIILAATNRPDVLDPALLRPGRFDRQITVPLPDIKGREDILNIHLRKVPVGPDVEPKIIARGTPGFSGADLANLVNEAALLAARKDKKVVTMADLEHAKDKVMMGAERKSMVMGEEEKTLTAYHEAGHAIVGIHMPVCDPIHKATIIPRGRALGMVMRLPEKDQLSVTREKLKGDIAMALGGRLAEEIIFGYDKVTSGASSDIKYVTKMARSMVASWGMSDKVGPVFHGDSNEEVFLGYSMGKSNPVSEQTANLIDAETKLLIEQGEKLARKTLMDNIGELHTLAKALLEYETLTGDEITDLLAGKKIRLDEGTKPSKPVISSVPRSGGKAAEKPAPKKKSGKKTTPDDAPQGA